MPSERIGSDVQAEPVDLHRLALKFVATGILLLAFGLQLSSAARKSATVDEQSHLLRGVAYLEQGATQFLLGHPLLGSALSAIPLLTEPALQLPVDTPAWQTGDWSVAGDAFLWQGNVNPLRLIFLGRLPIIWLTLLLGALVFRWGREWAGPSAGLLALGFLLMDPNVLAHGRLITGDLPLVLFFVLTSYAFWRWTILQQRQADGKPGSSRYHATGFLILAGLGLGLAGATKFNAALLLPVLVLWSIVLAWRWRSWKPFLALAIVGLIAWFTIWLVYGFSLWHGFLPGGAFWDDVLWQLDYVGEQHGVYLLGQISARGWWYYFPLAFLLKTPAITLLLLGVTVLFQIRRPVRRAGLFLLLPPAIYLVGSIMGALNIGYRYLLPGLPFVMLFISILLVRRLQFKRLSRLWPAVILGLYVALGLWVWPDYLSYFNVFAGRESWKILSDSNIDWGQDLPALREWQARNDSPLKLSYFGTAHPSQYGLSFESLPTWPPGPEQVDPQRQPFYPPDPAPGTYAISVTNLHGVVLGADQDIFAEFREQEPVADAGGSIFIYQVPAYGEPAEIVFSGLTPMNLRPELYERFETNDIRVRWADVRHAFVWPEAGGWLATTSGEKQPPEALQGFWPAESAATMEDQRLYRLPSPPSLQWDGDPVEFGNELTLLGWRDYSQDETSVALLSAWVVKEPTDRPLKIFVHALDGAGQIVAQWDGLDLEPSSLYPGDVFVQWHEFDLPTETNAAALSLGVYDGETLERWGEPISISSND